MTAKDIMNTEVKVVKPEDNVEQVAKILLENGISGLPVVDEKFKVVGMISEGDLIFQNKKLSPPAMVDILGAIITVGSQEKYFNDLKRTLATTVRELMVKNVFTVNTNTTIEDIATAMVDKNINRVPVVDNDKLVGIITRQDLIRAAHR
ncbi:hypothetical protein BHF68_04845 [Desulfuribacillus alkaliarsenatis]|uniref:CBS domain-containing protein n=1 Tax=Desulfuribacillus alkaliarsenatis TaxID=766136 RepID=A0A1E5G3M6_9FIRM|nr:hypothetical protein BHF68_04845 [Desulfuribacillus alkaliarsenatis]